MDPLFKKPVSAPGLEGGTGGRGRTGMGAGREGLGGKEREWLGGVRKGGREEGKD